MSSGIRFKDGKILFRGTYGTSIGFGDNCCCDCPAIVYPIKVYRSGGVSYATSGGEKYDSVEAVARDSNTSPALRFSQHKANKRLDWTGGYQTPTYSGCELVEIGEFTNGDPDTESIDVSWGVYPDEQTITVKKSDCLTGCVTCAGGPSEDPYDNWCNCDGTYGP